MASEQLFSVQMDENKLKSLYMELANHENISGGSGEGSCKWHAAEKERIEKEIAYYGEKIQRDRKAVDNYIEAAPYPECDIIRYRVINGLEWDKIGDLLAMDRRTASRRFQKYVSKVSI